MAGAIEGTLILFGAAIITDEVILRLVRGGRVHTIGIGIAVIVVSTVVNLVVSRVIARRARETGSVALEAALPRPSADVASSAAVLVGLVLVAFTHAEWIDPAVALVVAVGVAVAGAGNPAGAPRPRSSTRRSPRRSSKTFARRSATRRGARRGRLPQASGTPRRGEALVDCSCSSTPGPRSRRRTRPPTS